MRFAIEQKAATMTESQRKTLGDVRGSTHEQAIRRLIPRSPETQACSVRARNGAAFGKQGV